MKRYLLATFCVVLVCVLTTVQPATAEVGEFTIPDVIPLRTVQLERLRELIRTDEEAKSRADEARQAAESLLVIKPTPLEVIHYEGLVNTDPLRVATVKKLQQMGDAALLVRYWQASGDPKAAAALKRLIVAWSNAYRPTGNDVNENKLYPLLIAYEALRSEFNGEQQRAVDDWVQKLGELHHAAAVMKSDHLTNRYSKHLRLSALCGMILDRKEWVQAARDGVKRFVTQSLRADGTSRDLEWRDSLGYHGSALRPPIQLAILAGEAGRGLYSWESEKGGSLKKSVDYLVPYAMGEKIHREWVDTKVQLDRDRATAGIEKYKKGKPYDPQDAREVMELASYFDPELMRVVRHLSDSADKRFPTWTTLTNAAASDVVDLVKDPDVDGSLTRSTTTLFVSGENGYHTYRIPSLLVTKQGALLAFCEGRKTSWKDHGDVDLLIRRSTDNGRTWSPQQIVYEEGGDEEITIGNPCPVVDQTTGIIWLPLCRDNKQILITFSEDDGRTWAKPRDLSKRLVRDNWTWVATGPGVGIQLRHGKHAGRLVIPCDHRDQEPVKDDSRNRCFSHVIYSDDHGKKWQVGGITKAGSYESQVVELADGRLMLNARMQQQSRGFRGVSYSEDGGATWSDIKHDEQLPDPICQGSLVRYESNRATKDADILLFSNPAVRKQRGADMHSQRKRLTVKLSRDDGETWAVERVLHGGPAAYSCLAVLPDGTILCLYEAGKENYRETFTLARFNLQWLLQGSSPPASGDPLP